MAIFAPNFTATENANTGTSILITDTSNWTTNDEGYQKQNFTRTLVLKDAYGEVITSIVIPSTENSVKYSITGNQWIDITLNITGAQNYTKNYKFPFQRLYQLKIGEILQESGCECGCGESDSALYTALVFADGANFAALSGNASEFQNNITAAYNTLLA